MGVVIFQPPYMWCYCLFGVIKL